MCPPYRAALQPYRLAGLLLLFTGHILSAGCRKSQRLLRVRPQDRIPQKLGCLRFDTVPLQSGCSCSLLLLPCCSQKQLSRSSESTHTPEKKHKLQYKGYSEYPYKHLSCYLCRTKAFRPAQSRT